MSAEPVEVAWEVFEDEAMTRPVRRGRKTAVAEAGHAVHVEVAGLRPDREYWYRFTAGGYETTAARTRTTPVRGAEVEALRLAFGSCQKFEAGHYPAHAAIAADRPDLVLFLGDYIYEGAAGIPGERSHPAEPANNLETYRLRYAWYKRDANLQAAHAIAPWMVIWDDHEVDNNYGDDQDASLDPMTPAAFLKRRAAAYQAFYENMPLRRTSRPIGPDMLLYRSLDWGRLAQFQFLDTRQHRSPRACDAQRVEARIPADCQERFDPRRTMLGAQQEAWLTGRFRTTRASWNLLAQQYLMGDLALPDAKVGQDGWEGQVASRTRIMQGWQAAKVANPVVMGGDMHCFFAGDMAMTPGGPPVASEFVGGSISSLGTTREKLLALMALNPRLAYGNSWTRGYGRVDLTPKTCAVTFRGVLNPMDDRPAAEDIAAFVVENGEAGLKRA